MGLWVLVWVDRSVLFSIEFYLRSKRLGFIGFGGLLRNSIISLMPGRADGLICSRFGFPAAFATAGFTLDILFILIDPCAGRTGWFARASVFLLHALARV